MNARSCSTEASASSYSIWSSIAAAFPGADDPNKALAVIKIVGLNGAVLVIGAVLYWERSRRRAEAVSAA